MVRNEPVSDNQEVRNRARRLRLRQKRSQVELGFALGPTEPWRGDLDWSESPVAVVDADQPDA